MISTSGDVFCEVLVSHKKGLGEIVKTVAAVVGGVVLTALVILKFPYAFIVLALVWLGVYFFVKMQTIEYEYAFTSGELDVDKISGNMKRKRKLSINMESIELVAQEGSTELDAYNNGKYHTLEYSANDASVKNYVLIGSAKGEMIRLIFTPNDRLLEQMFYCAPRKVKK